MSYGDTFILKSNQENGNLKCKLHYNNIDKEERKEGQEKEQRDGPERGKKGKKDLQHLKNAKAAIFIQRKYLTNIFKNLLTFQVLQQNKFASMS